jgi:hypothetical protein
LKFEFLCVSGSSFPLRLREGNICRSCRDDDGLDEFLKLLGVGKKREEEEEEEEEALSLDSAQSATPIKSGEGNHGLQIKSTLGIFGYFW